jgi:hypothetical protein
MGRNLLTGFSFIFSLSRMIKLGNALPVDIFVKTPARHYLEIPVRAQREKIAVLGDVKVTAGALQSRAQPVGAPGITGNLYICFHDDPPPELLPYFHEMLPGTHTPPCRGQNAFRNLSSRIPSGNSLVTCQAHEHRSHSICCAVIPVHGAMLRMCCQIVLSAPIPEL